MFIFSEYEEKEYACLIFEQDHVPEFLSGKSGVYEKEADYKELIPRLKERTDGRMLLFRVSCFQWICLLSQESSPEQTGRFIQKLLYEEYDLSFSVYFLGKSYLYGNADRNMKRVNIFLNSVILRE